MTVPDDLHGGPIAWMARHRVAPNLLMIFFIAGGAMMGFLVKQEVFPEVDLDRISVVVPYPGASPDEVEQGILLPIEEEVRGLDGIKRVTAVAAEGSARVETELLLGTDDNKLLQDVKNAVDRIVSFPEDSERPIVSLMTNRRQVSNVIVYGDQEEMVLRRLVDDLREELLQDRRITLVELRGARPMEISVEVPQRELRAYGLTLGGIARRIERSALDLPGGGVKTPVGEVLVRTAERRDYGAQFSDIPVVSREDGTEVALGDIAEIIDGFADTDEMTFFDGKPAQQLVVFRVGDETPGDVARAVEETIHGWKASLPPGVDVTTWNDMSEMFSDRMNLLLRNARLGLILVLVLLGLFLEVKLAFWVTIGIPISFLGGLLFLPAFDVSINMISLFAFIVTLGIVVDDAIVVGENVYEFRQRGLDWISAAIRGTRQIAVPVTFSILTNMAAFAPMFFVPGTMGKFFRVIPAIVVAVFAISWVESLFVLPAHLGHQKAAGTNSLSRAIRHVQALVGSSLQWVIRRAYTPAIAWALRNRYFSLGVALAVLITTIGYVLGERIDFVFMPRVESDVVSATATLPYGSPVKLTIDVERKLEDAARRVLERNGGLGICRGILAQIGAPAQGFDITAPEADSVGGHVASVIVVLVPSDRRDISAGAFEDVWRKEVGEIAGLETLTFISSVGPAAGAAVDVELSHRQIAVLEAAARDLADELKTLAGVTDVDKGFSPGKMQLDFKIRPEASSLGLLAEDVGRQVRNAFYGAEALRQQRGRDEVRVYVRLPEEERTSEFFVEDLVIRTPQGGEIPLGEAVEVIRDRAYTSIRRADGRRVLNVTCGVEEGVTTADKVLRELTDEENGVLNSLVARYRGLRYGFEGQQRERRESLESLQVGFSLAMLTIFAMLAIPFRSYFQPVIIMTAIPFGIVGAVSGHILMGYDLSLISVMGMVALSGVVVNDSLVLVHTANRYRSDSGENPRDALVHAGTRRFRPIVLTSLTTFIGLAPMIFETSVQARFLIPMAISLGFGILFTTIIALLIVPVLYLILEDLKAILTKLRRVPPEA